MVTAPATLPICIETPPAVSILCIICLSYISVPSLALFTERSQSIADTLVYARAAPETMATVVITPVHAASSTMIGSLTMEHTIIKTEHASHKNTAIQIDFLGWKKEAEIEAIGAATNDAF